MLLLGAGSNISQAVAENFEAEGYRVAIAARRIEDGYDTTERWSYKVDLNKPHTVVDLFTKVTKDIGIPSVVVYNGKEVGVAPPIALFKLTCLCFRRIYQHTNWSSLATVLTLS
jgi:NADP-dependent 3-hydroxy acid dehydrogenase YdfG